VRPGTGSSTTPEPRRGGRTALCLLPSLRDLESTHLPFPDLTVRATAYRPCGASLDKVRVEKTASQNIGDISEVFLVGRYDLAAGLYRLSGEDDVDI